MYLVPLNLGNSGPGTPGPGTPSLGTLGLGTPDQGTPGLGTPQSRYPKAGYPWIGTLAGYPSLGRCMASHDFNWQRHLKMASPPRDHTVPWSAEAEAHPRSKNIL